MKTSILAASFCLLTSLSASAGTYICDLATTGQSGLIVELSSTEPGSEAWLYRVNGQPTVHATLSRSFNPYFFVLEIAPEQSLSGKAYLERAVLDYGKGELILGADSFACRLSTE